MNYLVYPLKNMRITQSYNGSTSHAPHNTGTPKDYPIDDGGKDTSNSETFIVPCDEVVVKRIYGVGNGGVNTIWFESTSKVNFANGDTDYVTILVTHPSDTDLKKLAVGKKYKRGQKLFGEGKDGATGYHHHISAAKGKYKDLGWTKNSNGKYVITATGKALKPEDAFFLDGTNVLDSKGLKFKQKPKDKKMNTKIEIDKAEKKDDKLDKTFTVTADALRLRTGVMKDQIGLMPKGSTVRCYGYYTPYLGVKWLLVEYKDQTGFCSSQFLK